MGMKNSEENVQEVTKKVNKLGDSKLILAAREGDLAKLKEYSQLIKLNNSWATEEFAVFLASHRNNLGKSALHEAAQNDRGDCVNYLLRECKVDPGKTIVMQANKSSQFF